MVSILALAFAVVAGAQETRPEPKRVRIVVKDFDKIAGAERFDILRRGLAESLQIAILPYEGYQVIMRDVLWQTLGDLGVPFEEWSTGRLFREDVLKAVKADYVVGGSFVELGGNLQVRMTLSPASGGPVAPFSSMRMTERDVSGRTGSLARQLVEHLSSVVGITPRTVAVSCFVDKSQPSNMEGAWRARDLAGILGRQLTGPRGTTVIDWDMAERGCDNPLTPPAASERADAVVTGTVRIERGLLVIAPELFIVQTRSRIPILPLSDKVSEYPALRAQLSRRVGEYLSGGLSTDGKWVLTDLASSTLDATTALARGKAVSQENPGLARLFFYRVLTLQPDSAEAMYFIGSGQLGQRRFSDAVLYFQKTLMPGARLPEELRVAAYLGLGQALSGIGNYPDAIKAYESAVQAKPDDPSLYRELARVYIFENHFSDADEYFRRAIDKEPRDIESYYGRGLMALRRNGEDDAVGFFRQALAIDSTHESARGALADVFARQAAKNAIAKQWDAAIAEVNEELLYRESARAYFLRGYYNVEAAKGDQDRYRAAIKDNQRALDLMGKNPVLGLRTPIMLNTTELHLLTKQYDEAKVWATRSLREVTEPSGRTIARFLLVVAKILSQEEYAEDQKRLRNDLKETGARSSWNFGTLEALLRADKTIGDAERQAALALSAEAKGTPPRP